MPLKFNPFTAQFDLTGSGGGGASYIDGEVAVYADLSLDAGVAPLNSAWLVRTASGVWPVSRKQAGIYIRTATAGSNRDADYTYAGTMPDVFSDSQFLLYDNSDTSKNLAFDLGGITTGTTRTLTAPNASGRIQVEGQAIGNTTPAAGTFTTLAANNGTLTASAPVLDLAQTWNNSAVTFTGLRFNVTSTASAAASIIADFQVDGTSRMRITRGGTLQLSGQTGSGFFAPSSGYHGTTGGLIAGTNLAIGGVTFDVILERDAADTLAQRRTTNAQTFNIYNTFTSATNHERLRLAWASNVAIIGTEKGSGGGTARALEFQTDGVSRYRISATAARILSLGTEAVFGSDESYGVQIVAGAAGTWRCGYFTPNGSGTGLFAIGESLQLGLTTGGTSGDVRLFRDAANQLALRNSTSAQIFRIYNTVSGTGNVNFDRVNFRWASNEFIIDAEAGGTGTLRGIKIGSATTSLLGFYGATPVDQPATVADPAGGGTVDTEARTAINDIIDRLQELGLIA